jgi:FKBP-type peptidyl-prolyl cis-trans isomerase SlpA
LDDHSNKIAPGSQITMHFSLTLTDGTEAASTFGDEPTTFTMGEGTLSEGLELCLYGLVAGDEQTLTLDPDQAFGPRDESKIHPMPRDNFNADMELEPGLIIGFTTPDEQELAGIVLEIQEHEVIIDFNHPLAGNEVVFKVEILAVETPQKKLDS